MPAFSWPKYTPRIRPYCRPLTTCRVLAAIGAFTIALVVPGTATGAYRDVIVADSPSAFWRFGEASGTTAADDTANANLGTYVNGGLLGAGGALDDGSTAVSLDGANDYITVPNATILNPASAITLEAWVKPTSGGFATVKPIIVKSYTSHVAPFYQYALTIGDVGTTYPKLIEFDVTVAGTRQFLQVTNSGWQYGVWNHLVATYDGATMRIYRNGAQVGSRAQTGALSAYPTPLDVGCYENLAKSSTYCFNGTVDEAAVYPFALSASQVQAHYAASQIAPPENLSPPSISGVAGAGAVLTASPGTWTNNPTSLSYQWQRCDRDGANCVVIPGATGQTYTLTTADTGTTTRVAVDVGNAAGAAPTSTASQTALVGTQLSQRTYSSNTTWTTAGSPYILVGNVTIASGATLTIQPGTIVKFNDRFREMQVNGNLTAAGTSSAGITFTSLQDDTAGGDSGGDGPTNGAKGQWYHLEFGSSSNSQLSFVSVRYGGYGTSNYGYGAIHADAHSTVTVDHSTISYNTTPGINVDASCSGCYPHAIVRRSFIEHNGAGIHVGDAWLEVEDGTYVRENGARGIDFWISDGYPGNPSTVTGSDVTGNDGAGISLTVDPTTANDHMPTGHGNNIYNNGGQLNIFYTHLDDDWSGNFWGYDVYFFSNPGVCQSISPYSPGKLAYQGSTGNPPQGPVDAGVYSQPPPDPALCGYDKVKTIPFSPYYLGGHGRLLPPQAVGPLLHGFLPELRYDINDSFRADAANELTDNYQNNASEHYSNTLETDGGYTVIAAADPSEAVDDLNLAYLGPYYPSSAQAQIGDNIDAANSYEADAARLHANPTYADRIYSRVHEEASGEVVLQYWLFYYFNGPFPGDIAEHEGDWEMTQIRLSATRQPIDATFAQHGGGERCEWVHVQRTPSGHPIVYVAEQTHASFFSSGDHYFGAANWDNADGLGAVTGPDDFTVIDITNPAAWLSWPGKWGASGASPHGPSGQGAKWWDPVAWSNSVTGCTEEQTP